MNQRKTIWQAGWVYGIFFISGMAGLIYQVIWVREFGQLFGNTVSSASIVAGLFVFGLGIGAFLAGRKIDHEHTANASAGLKYYIIAEALIGFLGLIISLVIPQIESLSSLVSSYQPDSQGWFYLSLSSYFLRGLIAFILLTPITILMGATLTFLIRYLMAHTIENSGLKIGLLYGLNTLGAAMGCALVDLWAVPHIGLMATKMLAVGLNFVAAFFAILLLKKNRDAFIRVHPPVVSSENLASRPIWPAGLAIALSGFCAMGMEIVWFRFISSLYSSRRGAFSMTLVILLVGMWLGATLSGYLTKKNKNSDWLYIFSQMFFVIATFAGFYYFIISDRSQLTQTLLAVTADEQKSFYYFVIEQLQYILPLLKIILAPSVAMGMAYPFINEMIQKNTSQVGGRAGLIYLWNSVGALLGSLITGFILLPAFGMQMTTVFLCLIALLATLPVLFFYARNYLRTSSVLFKARLVAGIILLFTSFGLWLHQPNQWLVKNGYRLASIENANKEILKISEGVNETAMVVQTRNDGARFLFTNGHSMSGNDYASQRYMRAFAHIPLLQIEKPETALIICFGVGNTSHAVSLHTDLKRIDVVDISENVLSLANYFESNNMQVLKDPRVKVYINDGRQHLRMQNNDTYDLITLEPPPLVSAGVASLYSKEFYQLAEKKLKTGGYITQWLPIYQITGEHARQLIKSFIDVFPNGVILNGFGRELILMGQKKGSNKIDWQRLATTIDLRPLVKADLKKIDLSTATEILGTFMASGPSLREKLNLTTAMTDQKPVIEYSHYFMLTELPKELFQANSFSDWCPTCFKDGALRSEIQRVDSYLSLLQTVYSSAAYAQIGELNSHISAPALPFGGPLPVARKENIIRTIEPKIYNEMIDSFGGLSKMFGPAHVAE